MHWKYRRKQDIDKKHNTTEQERKGCRKEKLKRKEGYKEKECEIDEIDETDKEGNST